MHSHVPHSMSSSSQSVDAAYLMRRVVKTTVDPGSPSFGSFMASGVVRAVSPGVTCEVVPAPPYPGYAPKVGVRSCSGSALLPVALPLTDVPPLCPWSLKVRQGLLHWTECLTQYTVNTRVQDSISRGRANVRRFRIRSKHILPAVVCRRSL